VRGSGWFPRVRVLAGASRGDFACCSARRGTNRGPEATQGGSAGGVVGSNRQSASRFNPGAVSGKSTIVLFGAKQRAETWDRTFQVPTLAARFRLDFPESRCLQSVQPPRHENRIHPRERGSPCETRRIGSTHSDGFLSQYLEENVVALFANPRIEAIETCDGQANPI
jgi:hypothetical protein